MAKLTNFRSDSKARNEGEWRSPGEEFEDLEVRVRGLSYDKYQDALAARQRKAAQSLGGDVSKLPAAIARRIVIDCLNDFIVLDVRNLEDASGPVDVERFKVLLQNPDYDQLVSGVIRAAAQVGQQKPEDLLAALGNSVSASGGPSPEAPKLQAGSSS